MCREKRKKCISPRMPLVCRYETRYQRKKAREIILDELAVGCPAVLLHIIVEYADETPLIFEIMRRIIDDITLSRMAMRQTYYHCDHVCLRCFLHPEHAPLLSDNYHKDMAPYFDAKQREKIVKFVMQVALKGSVASAVSTVDPEAPEHPRFTFLRHDSSITHVNANHKEYLQKHLAYTLLSRSRHSLLDYYSTRQTLISLLTSALVDRRLAELKDFLSREKLI
jgi:hypothetical protein